MKVAAVETVRPRIQPNVLFVLLHADDGLTGLGEAFFGARAVEAYVHETLTPALFTMTDPTPERANAELVSYLGYQGGVETRGYAAVDLALRDLLGQRAALPLARLLGGPVREEIRTYNTCAGSGYVRTSPRQASSNRGLPADGHGAGDRYEDLAAFLERPGELAVELRDEGCTGVKVWPFDRAAERTYGHEIARFQPYRMEDPMRAHAVPVAPHDCTGPVGFAAAVHLVLSQPNGLIQETVRAFLRTWYLELVDGLPEVGRGTVAVGSAPGHGVRLRDDYRDIAETETSTR